MKGCDTLLMVGIELPVRGVPARRRGRRAACRSTSTARMLGMRYPMEVNLVGDARETLRALLPLLERKAGPLAGGEQIEREVAEWWRACSSARADGRPTRSIRSASSGSCRRGCRTTRSSPPTPARRRNWYARDLKMRAGCMASLSGGLATMGCGGAVRDRGEVRVPGPAGDRARRRRRDADERHQRADHRRKRYWERLGATRALVLLRASTTAT